MSRWLNEEDHSWLLILDNADNAEFVPPSAEIDSPLAAVAQKSQRPLNDYLPQILNRQKSLLVTTRSRFVGQELAHGELCVEVPPLLGQEAKALLQLKLRDSVSSFDASTERLLDILGYIPLAITQAAAFISRNRWTVQGYLAALEKNQQNLTDHLSQELQDPRRPHAFPNSVFRTWKLSFDQILTQEPETAKLLSLIAMLDPRRIPKKLLQQSTRREVDFMMAIGTLDGFALISSELGGETFSIHPLVQASVHFWLEQRGEKVDYADQALQLLAKEFPTGEHEHKDICESLLVHAEAVLCHIYISENGMRHRAALLYNVGWFHDRQGRYISAYQAAFESYNIHQKQMGDVAIVTLNSLSLLAVVLQNQGKHEEAEKLHQRALEGYEKVLGSEDRHTLTSVSNLALVLLGQGKHQEAEKLYQRALEGYEKVLGSEHPNTLNSVSHLASVLQDQGKHEEAEKMHRRALEGEEKVLGSEHPNTLTSVSHLASVLQDQGKHEEAEKMNRRALEGEEKVLGSEHPNTLTSVGHLALVLQDQGKHEEAEKMHRRALEGKEKVLGSEHPNTLNSVSHLALVLQDQGKHEEAEKMNRRALEGYEKVLGSEHPNTLTSVGNLALVLQDQGKHEEAEKMHRRALEGKEKVLGSEHPNTLNSVSHLALVLQDQGKHEEAEKMNRRALEGYEKVLGSEHPNTLTSAYNLAYLLHHQQRYHDASILYLRASTGFLKTLGPDHPKTQACSEDHAAMVSEMKSKGRDV